MKTASNRHVSLHKVVIPAWASISLLPTIVIFVMKTSVKVDQTIYSFRLTPARIVFNQAAEEGGTGSL